MSICQPRSSPSPCAARIAAQATSTASSPTGRATADRNASRTFAFACSRSVTGGIRSGPITSGWIRPTPGPSAMGPAAHFATSGYGLTTASSVGQRSRARTPVR